VYYRIASAPVISLLEVRLPAPAASAARVLASRPVEVRSPVPRQSLVFWRSAEARHGRSGARAWRPSLGIEHVAYEEHQPDDYG
jgi:hypothetical protein